MDNTSNRYPVDWIREQWMSLYTPENCQSYCASPAALINVYRSIAYSANQMVGAFHRDNHSTAAAKTLGLNYVVPYTNARGVIWDEDTAQFMDEWSEYDVADPRWEPDAIQRWGHVERFQRNQSAQLFHNASVGRWPGFAYQTDPVRSYTDMALHYTRKMLDSFAGGIYCERDSGPLWQCDSLTPEGIAIR